MEHSVYLRTILLLMLQKVLNVAMGSAGIVNGETMRSMFYREPITIDTMKNIYPKLLQLDMSNQTAYEFPTEGPFVAQHNLNRFICNNCSIHSIYRHSLSKVPHLTHLELRANGLTYIHPDAFKRNRLLDTLVLIDNHLTTINPEATLNHLSSLAVIDLSHNVDFDLNMVKFFTGNLISFTCHNCGTTFLSKFTMIKMPRLFNLTLPNNCLKHIKENAFADLNHFKILNIDGNRQLRRLNIHSKTLKYLNAQQCNLEGTLDTSAMPQLEVINVRRNHLARINEHGFEHNPNIHTILLDDNAMKKIPTKLLLLPLDHFRVLCIDRNPLQPSDYVDAVVNWYKHKQLRNECFDDSSDYKMFEYFLPNYQGVALYTRYPIYPIAKNVTTVDFSNNNIVAVEQDYLEQFDSVEQLIFDGNSFFDFKPFQSFLRSKSIKWLSMKNCSISHIDPVTFKEVPNLQYIDLEGNQIGKFQNLVFKHSEKLKWLSLARNKIQYLYPNVFVDLGGLQTLRLDGNKHLTCTQGIEFLTSFSLEELSCSFCGFSHLDNVTVSSLRNLTKLDLTYNKILTISSTTFQWNVKLLHVNLQGNHLITFEPSTLKLPLHLSMFCFHANLAVVSKIYENNVSTDTIERMMRLQEGCSDKVIFQELSFLYHVKTKQTEIPVSPDQYVDIEQQLGFRSASSSLPNQFVVNSVAVVLCWLRI